MTQKDTDPRSGYHRESSDHHRGCDVAFRIEELNREVEAWQWSQLERGSESTPHGPFDVGNLEAAHLMTAGLAQKIPDPRLLLISSLQKLRVERAMVGPTERRVMEMRVCPAHHRLQAVVEVGERGVAANQ